MIPQQRMQYRSTRATTERVGFSRALLEGLAQDGGLYAPEAWPAFRAEDFPESTELPAIAAVFLQPFAAGDPVEASIAAAVGEAFDFPAPLLDVGPECRFSVLELFHGPTAAFKDYGARFLASCFARIADPDPRPVKILVATSGDTGGAVAAAFHRRANISVDVLYPRGLVSPTQEQQLTCWGDNVTAYAVEGTFDDCQRLAKAAFADPALRQRFKLSSANSINLGRLLPQAAYYAAASLAVWRRHGTRASFIVPSGNLGNVVACAWARRTGLPIGEIVLAHNANRTVPDFLATGEWRPRPSLATLASAMDVGNPSNMERLRALYPDPPGPASAVSAYSVDDHSIRDRIRQDFARYGQVWCPHTATAAEVFERLPDAQRKDRRWVIVATAHPAKFAEIVAPLIGQELAVPPALAALFSRRASASTLEASLDALRDALH